MDDIERNLALWYFLERSDERFHRTLHVALQDHLQSRFLPFGDIGKEILERSALRRCELAVANVEEPLFTQEPRRSLAFHDHQFVSRIRQPTKTQDLNRHCRTRLFDRLSDVIDELFDFSPIITTDEGISHAQRPHADNDCRGGSSTLLELGFN